MEELEFKPGMKVTPVGDLSQEMFVIKSVPWNKNWEIMRMIEQFDDGSIEDLVGSNNNGNGFLDNDELVLVEDDMEIQHLMFGPALEIVSK